MSAGTSVTKLSPRLESIARMVTEGNRLADIGTDHAYLPISLCQREKIPSAIAADLRTGPLEIASANILRAHLEERIEVRQSDGLTAFGEDEADTLVLAGMGGMLVCQILGQRKELLPGFREILLQPQSDIAEVRRFLMDNRLRIAEETCTADEGKFYPVIRAVPVPEREDAPVYTDAELAYGPCLLRQRDPLLKAQLEKQYSVTEQILHSLRARGGEAVSKRCEELREEEQLLRTAMHYYEM